MNILQLTTKLEEYAVKIESKPSTELARRDRDIAIAKFNLLCSECYIAGIDIAHLLCGRKVHIHESFKRTR